MPLSETELNDKNLLTNTLFTDIQRQIDFLGTVSDPSCTIFISMKPPMRCSDGKRRPYIMDYVDFLFEGESIEDLIESENAKTPGFIRSIKSFDWGFEISFKLESQ